MRVILTIILLYLLQEVSSWCLRTTLSEGMQIRQADWASDNSIFVTANKGQKTIRIYNAKTFELLKVYNHTGIEPKSIKVSKDSKYVAVGYTNSDLIVFHATSPFNIYFQKATGQSTIAEVDFTYDNAKVMSCGNDQGFVTYDLVTGNGPVDNYKFLPNPNSAVACRAGPLGHVAYSDNNRKVRVVDSSMTQIYLQTYADDALQIDFQPNSGTFGFAGKDNTLRINATTTTANTIYTDSNDILTVSFGKQGKYYAFGGKTLTLFIYNQTTNVIAAKFSNFKNTINSVKLNKDETFIIVADVGGEVNIFATTCFSTCSSGEYNVSGVCSKCSSAISYCVNCKSAATCDECMAGYYGSGGSCVACYTTLSYCLECKDSAVCLKCLDGYYLDAVTNTCKKCALQGCLECNDSLTCTKCFHNDFYLNVSTYTCKKCADTLTYCVRCYNSSVCVDCHVGFYEDPTTKTCLQCPGNCLICQTSTNCTQCKVGYWASAGSCIRCTDINCVSCNQTGICYDCKEGMFLTATNTCSSCTNPCATCSVIGTNCTGCLVGHYLDETNFMCMKCIQNCKVCNESAKCLNCFAGFKVDGTTFACKTCIQFYGNCSECSSSQCVKCRDGFYLDTAGGNICKTCSSMIVSCMQCSNSTFCLECTTSYYLVAGGSSCGACAAGCEQCISISNCTKCFSTYYLNASLLCTPCINNYFECSSAATCGSCVVGYYLDSGTNTCKACESALTYCSSCVDASTCYMCEVGTYLDTDNKCKLCNSHCLACNVTDCFSCQVGYYLDLAVPNTCKLCGQSCQQCTSLTVCTSCIDEFYLDLGDNKCKSCGSLFTHCTLCSSTACYQCTQGTALNLTTLNTCPSCNNHISNCKSCFIDTSSGSPIVKCSICNYGFGLSSDKLSCPQCNTIQGCIKCKSSSACTRCEMGYYLKPDNTCGLCGDECFTCDNAVTCLSCNFGYVNDTANCVLCETVIEGCTKCTTIATTYNCTYCQVGFYLSLFDTQCYICHQAINGCYTCNDSATCTSCLDKYFLDSSTQSCLKCVTDIPGCQLCNSSSVCLSCEDSYYLDVVTDKCYFCSDNIPGCLHCQDNTLCSQCESGYYLHANNTCGFCQSALQGCVYCNSGSFCIQCRGGFYLNTGDNTCKQCTQPGCDICQQTNPNICVNCDNKHYLVGSTCTDCTVLANYCYECNSTQCLQCEVGYYLSSGLSCLRCSSTMSGCSRCTDGSTCLECMSSYFVNGSNMCQQCNKVLFGCQNCIDSTLCISCSANFFLNSSTNACQPCTDITGCMLCKNQTACFLCQQKYYMESSKCLLCSQAIDGCFSCVSDAVCVQCQSGYVLNTDTYTCVVNTIEAKQKVEGLKLVSYYLTSSMLKHILYAKGTNFHQVDSLNITENAKTTLLVEDYTGKEVQLTILSYEFGKNGYSIVFYTDNPLGSSIDLNSRKMSFRRLLVEEEINLQVLMKMNEDVYQQILPQLDYSGSMTVGYSLNDPQFVNSLFKAEAGNQYLMYEIVGVVIIVLFLINYLVKFLCTLPHSRNRTTLLPHVIALKACCLIMYPTHFEYMSFCKGFMIVDIYWLNDVIAQNLTDLSDKVAIPFGLFFDNTSIAGTFLLGLGGYIVLALIIQAYFYLMNQQKKSQKGSQQSEISSSEQRRRQKKFKIQKLQQMMGMNYDNDQSSTNRHLLVKKNWHQLLWNVFTFSLVYYSCLSVQGAFYNYQQIITINGVFYILGMLLFIYVTVETFYSFARNFKLLTKVRVYLKACFLSLAYLNPIYIVSVCVALDILLCISQFYLLNPKNTFSKFFTFTHILTTISIALMIIVSQSLVSLFVTVLCLFISLGVEIYIHVKEYQVAHQNLQNNSFNPDQDQSKQQLQNDQNNFNSNIWNLNHKSSKNNHKPRDLEMYATMEVFDNSNHFEVEDVNFQKSQRKNTSSIRDVSKAQTKQKGRRTKLRKTQEAFRSNVIEVLPNPDLKTKQVHPNIFVYEEQEADKW